MIETAMSDKRISPRQRVLKTGLIVFHGSGVIECVVRNVSATGAAIKVVSPIGIPEEFTLVIEADGFKRACRVARRTADQIGVKFIAP